MSRALDVAAAWLRLRESELAFMAQQDETWREMIREGLLQPAQRRPRAETTPFSDIWASRARRPPTVPRGRRARTTTAEAPVAVAPTWLADWANPVPVVPTPEQVRAATEELRFSSIENPLNDRCPINQQPFEPDSQVARIRRCGHICEPSALRRWFTYSVRCPMCRLDIRDPASPVPTNATAVPVTANASAATATAGSDNRTSLPPPPLSIRAPSDVDLGGFASRIAAELASRILRDDPDSSGNLTVEYAILGPGATGPAAPRDRTEADDDESALV